MYPEPIIIADNKTEIVGFLQEQETNGNWVSKWLAKKRAEK